MRSRAAQRVAGRCRAKRRFRDHAEAIQSLRTIHLPGNARGHAPTRAYHCDLCNGWHLTKAAG